ncbi:MAG: hypothetical protein V4566_13585 [Pseudomonadota bacterium]|jgi:hypothetical protein
MSDVIDFLEKMGQDAKLRHGSRDEVELALASAEIAPELQAAIIAKDQVHLETLLGQAPVCVMYFPGEEEQDDESEETPPEEPGEAEHTGLRTAIPAA